MGPLRPCLRGHDHLPHLLRQRGHQRRTGRLVWPAGRSESERKQTPKTSSTHLALEAHEPKKLGLLLAILITLESPLLPMIVAWLVRLGACTCTEQHEPNPSQKQRRCWQRDPQSCAARETQEATTSCMKTDVAGGEPMSSISPTRGNDAKVRGCRIVKQKTPSPRRPIGTHNIRNPRTKALVEYEAAHLLKALAFGSRFVLLLRHRPP